ncbi:Ig-like domain-containing protein [Aureisphaera galaxeae]|uniref:Ig-like domain-containing protein n=1 Tax=Aureisphaera galaxeae TaxID=1538023 RepID=UPI00234FB628|nr:Ig-like domain-containing protein [Aureisphaera galaxeae]MDC8004238.1 Ig-like domain-containing protein [Aureisphaera galaxeae]
MKIRATVSLILLSIVCHAQIELDDFNWVHHYGQEGFEGFTDVTSDIFGNIYTVGYFTDTMDADPDPTEEVILTAVGELDVFIMKNDKDGNFIWAKQVGGAFEDLSETIATDASGNVYIAGYYEGTADFNPDPDVAYNLANADGWTNGFLLKLDVNGNFVWVKNLEGDHSQRFNEMTVDAQGNFLCTGYFRNSVDFDFGPEEFILTALSFDNAFILKLDSQGDFVWAQNISCGQCVGSAITTDGDSNVIASGTLDGSGDFDFGPEEFILASTGGTRDVFITKLTSDGDFITAGITGGINSASIPEVKAIKTDSNNNIYITGHFAGEVDFDMDPDPASTVYHDATGIFSIHLSKHSPTLQHQWSFPLGAGFSFGRDLEIDENDLIYITGKVSTNTDWDPDPVGIYTTLYSDNDDGYIVAYNADGTINSGIGIRGGGDQEGRGIHFDHGGNLIQAGFFEFNLEVFNQFDISIVEAFSSNADIIKFFNNPIPNPDNFPPVAQDDTATVDQGDSVDITVLQNDSDSDGALDENSIEIVSQPIHGTLSVSSGSITYTHDGSSTTSDSFSYTVMDNEGASSNVATVSVTIMPVNQLPQANDDAFEVNQGESITFNILANDTDPDGSLDTDSITITQSTVNGSVTILTGGNITYTHDDSDTTTDSFRYTVQDDEGGVSNEAEVSITIIPTLNVADEIVTPTNLYVYPNPTSGTFSVVNTSDKTVLQIVLYDVLGRKQNPIDFNRNEDVIQVDVQQLPNGVYFVEFILDTSIAKRTLVKR